MFLPWPSSLRSLVQENFWGLADQTVISATNFATLLILARALDSWEFGAFVLAYTALLFLNGIQTALVTQPHNVLGQNREQEDYIRYTSSTAFGQILLSALLSILVLIGATTIAAFGRNAALVVLALAVTIVPWQCQEFVRRVLYTEGRLATAFAVDVVSYGSQVAVLLVVVSFSAIDAAGALYVAGTTSLLGAAIGAWNIRRSIGRSLARGALKENWTFGKWLAAALAASLLAGQLYIYLTGAVRGATAAAALKAAQIVLGPLNTFLLFLFTILPIRFAQTYGRGGDSALNYALIMAYALTAPFVAAYCLAVAIFARPILHLLYGEAYVDYSSAVVLFSVYYFILHPVYLLTAALNARRQTRPLFTGNVYAALLSLVAGWPLIAAWGVDGAVIGMSASALLLAGFFWQAYRCPSDVGRTDAQSGIATAPPS
jgi:O-antigen/teichoic acid export membrane protein